MKKLFKKMSQQNAHELRRELIRAHIMIVLLSFVSIALLTLGATLTIAFDVNLSLIAGSLLTILALISLGIAIILSDSKK